MAIDAGEVQIGRVDMEKIVAAGVKLLQLIIATLRQNDVALVAIVSRDLLPVIGLVVAVVTAETAGPGFVANVVRMDTPVGLHFR
ncbi:MAG TPA: hypothetical protein VN939_24150, partial [Chthoniobacterales bacterium]|nr:hypothetical protein [Chthoniobacterales bacterium]